MTEMAMSPAFTTFCSESASLSGSEDRPGGNEAPDSTIATPRQHWRIGTGAGGSEKRPGGRIGTQVGDEYRHRARRETNVAELVGQVRWVPGANLGRFTFSPVPAGSNSP